MRATQNQFTQKHSRDKGAESVERLCQIQPSRCCFGRPQNGNIRIGSSLQETHTGSYDKENAEIGPIGFQHGSREKEQTTQCRQQ